MFNINRDSKNKEESKEVKVEQQAGNKADAENTSKKDPSKKGAGADEKVTDEKEEKVEESKYEIEENKKKTEKTEKTEGKEEKEDKGEKKEEQPETSEQKLNKEIDELKKAQSEEKDRYLRLAAEFDNYRRRTAKERLELIETASESVIKSMLPIVDDFERAIAVLKDSKDSDASKEGTELIYKKMMEILKNSGVTVIEAIGKDLNTDEHEAIAQIPAKDPKQKGKIVEIAQQGYKLNGKVIRFAKVVMGD
jgi:molecular chaperone GrpE